MKLCNGCLIECKFYKAYEADFITSMILYKCPCSICIIKMVCLKSCDEFKSYSMLSVGELRNIEGEYIARGLM